MIDNTWIELDLAVLRTNIADIRRALGSGSELTAVVKSNAYGHGMIPIVTCAAAAGVTRFAVTHVDEACRLAEAAPEAKVLILGVVPPDAAADVAAKGFTPVVVDEDHARALASACDPHQPIRCHAKVDTGMGRLGIPWQEAATVIPRLCAIEGIEIVGLCSHFASSDSPESDYTDCQLDRFRQVIDDCRAAGVDIPFKHISNSGGVLFGPEAGFDTARTGLLLYGYPCDGGRAGVDTRPLLHWKTRVIQVRPMSAGTPVGYGSTHTTENDTVLAVLDAGYADGYSRKMSNRGHVLIHGRRCPVVGRVSMNLITVDVGPSSGVAPGDEAVLLGTQGDEHIWADEIAEWSETIPYEVLTGIRTDRRVVLSPSE